MTALLRVSVAAGPGRMLDLALPGHLAVADLLPEIVRRGRVPPAAWRLVTATGAEVAPEGTLVDHGVGNGDVLALVDASPPRAAEEDDPAEALARTVVTDVLAWAPRLVRPIGLGISLALFLLAGFAFSRGPAWTGGAAAAAGVLACGVAVWSSRRHDLLVSAAAGWLAVGFAAVAGGQSAGPVAAAGAAAVVALLLCRLRGPLAVVMAPAAVAGAVLTSVAVVVRLGDVPPGLAAVTALASAALLSQSLPRAVLALVPDRPATARVLLRASLVASAVVLVVLATVTAVQGVAGLVLVLVVALLTACRGSRHHGAVEVVAGLVTATSLVLTAGAAVVVHRPAWAGFVGVVALALAGLAAAGSARHGASDPRWALALDRLELALLLAVVPLVVVSSGAVGLASGLLAG